APGLPGTTAGGMVGVPGVNGLAGASGLAGAGLSGPSSLVTFDPNDGGSPYLVAASTVGAAESAVPDGWPVRTGYVFLGWRTAPTGGTPPVGTDAASGQQFYAQWQLAPAAPSGPSLAATGVDQGGALAAAVLALLLGAALVTVAAS